MTKPTIDANQCGCGGCNVCMMRLALSGVKPPDLPRKPLKPAFVPYTPPVKKPEPKKTVQKPLFE